MEEISENNAGQGDDPDVTPVIPPGEVLREARIRLGLSLNDVSDQIKFAPRQIEALEAGDFQYLPEMTFVRGFVRNYAKVLHLDAQPLLAALPQAEAGSLQLTPDSVEVPFPCAHSPQRQNLVWLGAALLLAVLVVAFAAWHYTTPVKKSEVAREKAPAVLPPEMKIITESAVPGTAENASPASVAPPPQLGAAPVPVTPALQPEPQTQAVKPAVQGGVPSQNAALRLVFDDESWVEVKDKDGNTLSSQINARGSELRLDGNAPFSMAIGRAASVRLYHRGKLIDLKPHINSSNEVARLTVE